MTTSACHQARIFTTRASSPFPQLLAGSPISRTFPLRPSSSSLKRPFHSSLLRPVDPRNNPSNNTDDTSKSGAASAGKNDISKEPKQEKDKKSNQPTSTESTKTDEAANTESEPPSGWKLSQQKRRARGTPREGWLAATQTPQISDEFFNEVFVPCNDDARTRQISADAKDPPTESNEKETEPPADSEEPPTDSKDPPTESNEKETDSPTNSNEKDTVMEHSKSDKEQIKTGTGAEEEKMISGPVEFPPFSALERLSEDWQGHTKESMEARLIYDFPNGKDNGPTVRYAVSDRIWVELKAMIHGGLNPPNERYIDSTSGKKPHIMLHCPQDGGFAFLDAVVKSLASGVADLVVLNAQRIAREAEKFHQGDFTNAHNALWTLGYATHAHLDSTMKKSESKTQDYFEDMDDPSELDENSSNEEPLGFPKSNGNPRYLNVYSTADFAKLFTGGTAGFSSGRPFRVARHTENTHVAGTTAWIEALLDRVVESRKAREASLARIKTKKSTSNEKEEEPVELPVELQRNTIVQVSDFASMFSKPAGKVFIDKLLAVVQKRRKAGERIIVIGTHASEDDTRTMTFNTLHKWQNDPAHTRLQAVVVPCANEYASGLLRLDYRRKVGGINLDHLETMIRQHAASSKEADFVIEQLGIGLSDGFRAGPSLLEYVWRYEEIHRLANLLLGFVRSDWKTTHEIPLLWYALYHMRTSDIDKMRFIVGRNPASAPDPPSSSSDKRKKSKSDDKGKPKKPDLKALREDCNKHEKKLLNGVVNSADIKTTFSDVHVSPATIEALKTLTTLSLIRPEAFTYGVLANDKIPGLLLYGPPGTGKTLLAKAVAKESGATVLEVAGSDIYDMYVGEGEKNIRAVFGLAKKLSPCVIFIDEADAIFGSRSSGRNRSTHRELINQFLREWDGMHNSNAFIMVATNRPFDLDDAVLRRLPRRILVDLPSEKDRESILNIHLKNEQLDSTVSIADLASKTPFYSGSDLKNVSVAAALAAVKEENALAAAHEGDEPYVYPAKRTIQAKHFDKALEEISASISEDMGSLNQIRKFDERYGDGAGRKKRGKGLGFGMVKDGERERLSEEDSRVRKLAAA